MAQAKIIRVEGIALWQIRSPTNGGRYIAKCDQLSLVLEGTTWTDLMEAIAEGILLLFEELISTGDLERFFLDRGWQASTRITKRTNPKSIDLPWIPVVEPAHGAAHALS